MSGQISLTAFMAPQSTPPQPEAPQKCFGCDTCVCNLGITIVAGAEKVHCRGQGLKPVNRIGCSGWWDGKDRADSWPKLLGGLNRAEPVEANPLPCPECGATLGRRPAKHIYGRRKIEIGLMHQRNIYVGNKAYPHSRD